MDITWLGHSCFRIKGKEVSLITDPYDATLRYSWPKPLANIVTVSHPHPGHSNAAGVEGNLPRASPDLNTRTRIQFSIVGGISEGAAAP